MQPLAVAHSILVIAWHLPHNQTNYTDRGADWLVRATDNNTHRRDRPIAEYVTIKRVMSDITGFADKDWRRTIFTMR